MSSPPAPRSGKRTLYRWAIWTGVAGVICAIAATAIVAVALTEADRAEAQTQGGGEAWGFLALIAIFPCGAGVLCLFAALILVIVAATRKAEPPR
jgi:hypothetical protein